MNLLEDEELLQELNDVRLTLQDTLYYFDECKHSVDYMHLKHELDHIDLEGIHSNVNEALKKLTRTINDRT